MKRFLKEYSYDMVKMFLNQFATAIFGFSLTMATMQAGNYTLRNVMSGFSIVFYLFLLYVTAWEIGYRDKVSVDLGKKKRSALTGALISLCANSVNFLFAVFIMLGTLIQEEVFGSIGAVCKFLAVFLEGMYTGLLSHPVGGMPLNNYWFVWFIVPIPAILVSSLAYWLGLRDVKGTSLFNKHDYPASDREPKRKRDERND
ncbi:MAG: hypothetical protein E7643_07155 [Ruminococcaceae bacterium]|nr:hypothetical protein [Oscillospiraceae bacterium]